MARLYADENFPLAAVEELRRLGHDVTTARDSGQSNRATPDHEILGFARSEGRAVLTLNRKHSFFTLGIPITVASSFVRSTRTSAAKPGESTRRCARARTSRAGWSG